MSTATVLSFPTRPEAIPAAMARYKHLYSVAEKTIDFGETVRLAGICAGGVFVVATIVAYQVNRAEQSGYPSASLILGGCAIAAVLITHVLDRYFVAQGHLLEMAIDSAVHSSPFLTNAQRAEVMSLGQDTAAVAAQQNAA
jgi:hypothetical protein